jgi:hypothetical protein
MISSLTPLEKGRRVLSDTNDKNLYNEGATVRTLLYFYVCSDNQILFHCQLHAQKFLMPVFSTSTHLYADCLLQLAVVVLLCLFVAIDCLFTLSP